MRPVVITLAALAVLGAIVGVLVVFGGAYNVSAKDGHFQPVRWILHTSFRSSVKLRAPDSDVPPDLTKPGLAELGAKHYETACAVCHATPGESRWAIPQAMEPPPPHIDSIAGRWSATELFWIVREGVKMTGMPHWPAAREDDVWAVVAFLTQVGEISAKDYGDLIAPPAGAHRKAVSTEPEILEYCERCHGRDGQSGNEEIPRLDILSAQYLENSLEAYATGLRQSGIMRVAVSRITPTERAELARWYGAQTPPETANASSAPSGLAASESAQARQELIAAGETLATGREGDSDVPACVACHGPWDLPRSKEFPNLAGQSESYLSAQLRLWRSDHRGGGKRADLMRKSARRLSDADIAALAAYFAHLPAAAD